MQFIDIHSHILFGVDDGAENTDVALEMLRQAVQFNVRHIVATPHATEVMTPEIGDRFVSLFGQLKQAVETEELPIQVSLAAELFFSERIFNWLDKAWATFNGERKYLLFELPLFELPNNVDEFIFRCRMDGIMPILAHPERYMRLQETPEMLLKWYGNGCYMQLNAGSLVGQFGQRIRDFAFRLLESGMYQFLASDAHDIHERNFEILAGAAEEVSRTVSAEYAGLLCYRNPGDILKGNKIQRPDIDMIPDKERWYSRFFNKMFTRWT